MSNHLYPTAYPDGPPYPEPVRIQIGGQIVADIMRPSQTEVAEVYPHILERLKHIRRWSDHPLALTVNQHIHLVCRLVERSACDFADDDQYEAVLEWAEHHDDHEGVIGDIVGPMKKLIGYETNIIDRVERVWDEAICLHLGIDLPTEVIRGLVHRYDKAAETLEWIHAMGQPRMSWNYAVPDHLERAGKHLIAWARMKK